MVEVSQHVVQVRLDHPCDVDHRRQSRVSRPKVPVFPILHCPSLALAPETGYAGLRTGMPEVSRSGGWSVGRRSMLCPETTAPSRGLPHTTGSTGGYNYI